MHQASTAAAARSWVQAGTSAYRRISLALFLAGFSTFSLLYCVQPVLPELAAHFSLSPAGSSLALSVSTGSLAVAIFVAGALSQGRDKRRLMFASMALAALCNVAAALAPGWGALLAARALEGVLLGGVPAVAMAYLAEEIHPRDLGFSMGLYIGGTAFGGMAGRIGMGMLADAWGWRVALATVGVLGLVAAVGFVLLLPRAAGGAGGRGAAGGERLGLADHGAAWRAHLGTPALRMLFASAFLLMGVFVSLFNYVGFRLALPPYGLSQTQIGLVFGAYLFGMVASPAAGALADRRGRAPVLAGGVLLMAAGVLLTLATPLAPVLAGVALLTFGFFVAHAVASGWVGALAQRAKGHASSLYLLAYYLGSSVLGSVGGWFWEHGRWPGMVGFALALLGAAGLLALRLYRAARI
ncbi:YNFM family putative membrane transporter [Melaminivora alkalimesophila]|uniref:YNFM family putative membrane transporter n=1 Tax=Melaminivora alkalimesophila TaxID=1165852 RepID=A0A317R8E2_9BURK|nr:MFS transporter [Melaminivora alkalimesophila]PWW43711.1 YNFM family putative membrane transporter [Melaminivora alkalimesophila]